MRVSSGRLVRADHGSVLPGTSSRSVRGRCRLWPLVLDLHDRGGTLEMNKLIIGSLVGEASPLGRKRWQGLRVAARFPGSLFDYKGHLLAAALSDATGRFQLSIVPAPVIGVRDLELVVYDRVGREIPFAPSDSGLPGYVVTQSGRARIEDRSDDVERQYGEFVVREADAFGLKTTLGTGQALRYSEGNSVTMLMDLDAFTYAAAMMRFARQEVLMSQLFFATPKEVASNPLSEEPNLIFDFDTPGPLDLRIPRPARDTDSRPERELIDTARRNVDVRILVHAFTVPLFLRIVVGIVLFPYLVRKGISKPWTFLGDDLTDTD